MAKKMTEKAREGALNPPVSLLVKLGSAVVHAEELLSPSGHAFDKSALQTCLTDPEVVRWVAEMTKMAMLPLRRPSS